MSSATVGRGGFGALFHRPRLHPIPAVSILIPTHMLVKAADKQVREAALQHLLKQALQRQAAHVARGGKGEGALGQHVRAAGRQLHRAAAGVERRVLVALGLAHHGRGEFVRVVPGDAGREEAPRPLRVRRRAKERPHEHDLDVVAPAVGGDGLRHIRRVAVVVHGHKHDLLAVLPVDEVVVGADVVDVVEEPLPRVAAVGAAGPHGNLRRALALLAQRQPFLVQHLDGPQHRKVGVVGDDGPVGHVGRDVVKAGGGEPGRGDGGWVRWL